MQDNRKWQDRLIACTNGTQLGAIARCVLDRNVEPIDYGCPAFVGKAVITSDGFIMCNFVDREARQHMGAFVGSVDDLRRNVIGVADHLKLDTEERAGWFDAVRVWIAQDYSERGIDLPLVGWLKEKDKHMTRPASTRKIK